MKKKTRKHSGRANGNGGSRCVQRVVSQPSVTTTYTINIDFGEKPPNKWRKTKGYTVISFSPPLSDDEEIKAIRKALAG